MSKVFVVPKVLGTGAIGNPGKPWCTAGHLLEHFGLPFECRLLAGGTSPYRAALAKQLGVSYNTISELITHNDYALTNKWRRQNFINWLRKYFPNNEVKP